MKKDKIVQTLNPKVNRYVKIDRVRGVILSIKKSEGPYLNIEIVRKHQLMCLVGKGGKERQHVRDCEGHKGYDPRHLKPGQNRRLYRPFDEKAGK